MAKLTLATAQALAQSAIAHGEKLGVTLTVTVVDAGGRTVLVNRMDGALLAAIDGSAAKARTAVFFAGATADFQAAAGPDGPLFTMLDSSHEKLTFVGGGVPITVDGEIIGGIGVGGGTAEEDHQISSAAIAEVLSS